ncbi:MAG: response regulator transcription factor [Chloroflexia bacterium]|nr:response regulator transcription factor [Chloroflexia bacterium]
MEGFTGLQLIKSLKQMPKVILTTAYDRYAIDAFDLSVCDYLLKPISFERFLQAVNKCCQVADNVDIIVNSETEFNPNEFIYIKENKKIHKIFLSEINFIESMKEYVRIHTDNDKYLTKNSISNFESKLSRKSFIRVHKSYIVSIPKIKSFTSTTIELDKVEIPISRTYKNLVMNALDYKNEL